MYIFVVLSVLGVIGFRSGFLLHYLTNSLYRTSISELGNLFVSGIIADPENLYTPLPKERGQITYYNNRMDKYDYCPDEKQVAGSLARYNIPTYRELHFLVKKRR